MRATPTTWSVPATNNADPAPIAPPGSFPANDQPPVVVQSLRQAVINANANSNAAVETIQLEAGKYTLSRSNSAGQENLAQQGDLDITSTAHVLVIRGRGSSGPGATTIDQSFASDRVFHVPTTNVRVVFQDLIITHGRAQDDGVAGRMPDSTSSSIGGGILNSDGSVTLENVSFEINTASALDSGLPALGGGVASLGVNSRLVINASNFFANSVFGSSIGAASGEGGGIYVSGGALSVGGSRFTSNSAFGGGNTISASGGGPGAQGVGGAILLANAGLVNISNTTFDTNSAFGGSGGPSSDGGSLNTNTGGNAERGFGGALGVRGIGTIIVSNSTFSGNRAQGGNGGDARGPGNTVQHIAGNAGGAFGGAIYADRLGAANPLSLLITNSTFANSRAVGGNGGNGGQTDGGPLGSNGAGGVAQGGSLWINGGNFELIHVTIAGSSALGGASGAGSGPSPPPQRPSAAARGGGVFNAGATIHVRDSVIATNTSNDGFSVFFSFLLDDDFNGGAISDGHNFIGNKGATLGGFQGPGDQVGTGLNTIHPLLGPLQSNGGPSVGNIGAQKPLQTMLPLIGSPLIDKGTSAGLATDQRGQPRTIELTIVNNDTNGGDGTDIGAVELLPQFPWHNDSKPFDVTGPTDANGNPSPDGHVVAGDVVAILNYINAFGPGPVPTHAVVGLPFGFLDTTGGPDGTGDNFVSAADALAVINIINAGLGGEGESVASPSADSLSAPAPSPPSLAPYADLLALLALDTAEQAARRRRA